LSHVRENAKRIRRETVLAENREHLVLSVF
jgi:hypothetical protein